MDPRRRLTAVRWFTLLLLAHLLVLVVQLPPIHAMGNHHRRNRGSSSKKKSSNKSPRAPVASRGGNRHSNSSIGTHDAGTLATDPIALHTLEELPPQEEFLEAIARAHNIARSAFVGIQVERHSYIHHRDAFRELYLRFAEEPLAELRTLKELVLFTDIGARSFSFYHIWQYLTRSLERVLDYGAPTMAVYRLFEDLYLAIEEYRVEMRYKQIPSLQRTITEDRIRARQVGVDLENYTGTDATLKLLVEVHHYNRRFLDHVRRAAAAEEAMDLLDMDTVDAVVRTYIRDMRTSLHDQVISVYGLSALVEDDFFDLLRVYRTLAPLFRHHHAYLEEVRRTFPRTTVTMQRVPIWELAQDGGYHSRSVLCRIDHLGAVYTTQLLDRVSREPWREGIRDYPAVGSAEFEQSVTATHKWFVDVVRVVEERLRDEVRPVEIRDCPVVGEGSGASVLEQESSADGSMSTKTSDFACSAHSQTPPIEPLHPSTTCEKSSSRRSPTRSNSSTAPVPSTKRTTSPQQSPKLPISPKRTPAPSSICNQLTTASHFRYKHRHLFWKHDPADAQQRQPTTVTLDRHDMETLCKVRGHLASGENLSWSAVVRLVEALGGSVRVKGGSRTTWMVPTVHAYAIAVDRPHPSTRIGGKVYRIREVLLKKFGIDVEAFRPVVESK